MKFHFWLGAALSMIFASAAHAEAPAPASLKYFDENGNLVGQSVGGCDNYTSHAGNIHTPYFIQEQVLCKTDPNPHTAPRPLFYIVPGTEITYYVLPSFLSIQQACVIAECVNAGTPVIDPLMDKGWTWKYGAY